MEYINIFIRLVVSLLGSKDLGTNVFRTLMCNNWQTMIKTSVSLV